MKTEGNLRVRGLDTKVLDQTRKSVWRNMDVLMCSKKQYICNIEIFSVHLGMCQRTRWRTKNGTPTVNNVHLHLHITGTCTYVQFVTKIVQFCKIT
jgi:hypothetical protein